MGKRNKFTALMGILSPKEVIDTPENTPVITAVVTPIITVETTSDVATVITDEITSEVTTVITDEITSEVTTVITVDIASDIASEVTAEVTAEVTLEVAPVNTRKKWKPRPDSFEANYAKKTMWVRKDLLELLNDASVYKGDITNLLNEGLEIALKKRKRRGEKE